MKKNHFRTLMAHHFTKLRFGLALAAVLSTGVQAEMDQIDGFDSPWDEPVMIAEPLAESPFYPDAVMNMDLLDGPGSMFDEIEQLNPESAYAALTAREGTPPLEAVKGRVHIVSKQGASLGSPLLTGSFNTYGRPAGIWDADGDQYLWSNRINSVVSYPRSQLVGYFPRSPITDPQTGSWRLAPGRKLDDKANMVIYGRFSSWSTTQRDQIVALHLRVDRSSGSTVLHPVSMFAGDMDLVRSAPGGNMNGIMMYSNNVQLKNISGTADDHVFQWGARSAGWGLVAMRVSGEAEAFVNMTDPTGIVYAAQVRFEFKDVEVFSEM